MKLMKGHIRTSTAVLLFTIALLVGALFVAVGQRRVPVFIDTAHAAAVDQGPLTSFAPVVKRAMPAVVNISSSKVVKAQQMPRGMFDDPMFRQFFGGRIPEMQQPKSQRETSLGSGVVVSADGYILTNNHVVEGATDVKVEFSNKEKYSAKIVGTDKYTDVAVLKIDKTGLPTLPFADSGKVQVGDVVLAIGEPFGLGGTVTMGIVSAKSRSLGGQIERFEDFIQTDAAINHGNSGGALIDTHGELVGINTAILSGDGGGSEGIGFAIPANLARNVMDGILKNGKVTHGFMGILPQELTPEMAKEFNMTGHGVLIAQVSPDSPASKAGLKVGDVITAINSNPVDDVNNFRLAVAGFAADTTVHLKIFRDGKTLEVPVTLGEVSEGNGRVGAPEGVPGKGEKGALKGVSVQALTPEIREQMQLPDDVKAGVVITDLDEDSPAAAAGLQPGLVILQVNHRPVNTVAEFNSAVRAGASKESTLLLVRQGAGGEGFVIVPNK
jgi:serine protease Do